MVSHRARIVDVLTNSGAGFDTTEGPAELLRFHTKKEDSPMAAKKGSGSSSSGKYKSAVSGKYVKPAYAKTHPNTTYKSGR